MILQIDQGNTRTKWRMLGHGQVCAQAEFANREINWPGWLSELQVLGDIDNIQLASVAKPELKTSLLDFCHQQLSIEPQIAVTQVAYQSSNARLANSYSDVTRMGVDRWLAMVGAVEAFPGQNIVLVDAGSAITVEFIAAEGVHLGGFITPGIWMMQSSLLSNTGAVRFVDSEIKNTFDPGTDTANAVVSGTVNAALGLVAQAHKRASSWWHEDAFQLILCGGDAELFAKYFSEAVLSPHIVLDGLGCVFSSSRSQ